MFTPELWSWKCQKCLIFYIFCWWQQSVSHNLNKILRCIWKNLLSSFSKCYGLLNSTGSWQDVDPLMVISETSTLENAGFFHFFPQYLTNSNPSIPSYHMCTCPNVTIFASISRKYKKVRPFEHFYENNLRKKHDNETNHPIFLISYLSSIRRYIYFMHSKTWKFSFMGSPFCIMFWYVKYTFHAEDYIFKPVYIDILFLHKIC